MTDLPPVALDAALDAIERLGAGGSRTTVRIVLAAAAPLIAAAERERIRQFAIGKWERDAAERRNLWPSMAIEGSRIYQAGYADALDGCVHELRTLLTDPEGGQADGT